MVVVVHPSCVQVRSAMADPDSWPDLVPDPLKEGNKKGILTVVPPRDSDKTSSRDGVLERSTLEAASLNDAYRRLKEGGLVAVPGNFNPLGGISKRMIVDPGNPGSQPWNLVKAAVPPPRGNVRDGINSEAKCLPGPMSTSTLTGNTSNPGRVVNVKSRRRRKTAAEKKDPAAGAVNGNRKGRGEQAVVVPTQV